jgi:hypothetical protein
VEWARFLNAVRPAFLLVYGIFVIWAIVRWIVRIKSFQRDLRDWLGAIALGMAVCSAILLALFYVHVLITNELIAHGSELWIYYYFGFFLAVGGLILGLTGRGWVRESCAVVVLVASFQWACQMAVSVRQDALITVAMFVSLALVGAIFAGTRYFVPERQSLTKFRRQTRTHSVRP